MDFRLHSESTRRLADRAIHDPTAMKTEEILELAFTLIGMLDGTPLATPTRGR